MLDLKVKILSFTNGTQDNMLVTSPYIIFKWKKSQCEIIKKVTPILSLHNTERFEINLREVNKFEIWDYERVQVLFKANLCKIDQRMQFRFKIKKVALEVNIAIDLISSKISFEMEKNLQFSSFRLKHKNTGDTKQSQNMMISCESS